MHATAYVQLDGPPDAEIGFLQFLTEDTRAGSYLSRGDNRIIDLNYHQCIGQFLPCRDVEEATNRLVYTENRYGKYRIIEIRDSPSFRIPVYVSDAGDPRTTNQAKFSLVQTHWFMKFAVVLGVRLGADFQPIEHVIWSLESSRQCDVNNKKAIGQPIVKEVSRGKGMPTDLDVESAMSSRTCRFLARRNDFLKSGVCRPQVTSQVT